MAFINTASQEQLRRQMVVATDAADRAANHALRVARASPVVSVVSLIVTLVKSPPVPAVTPIAFEWTSWYSVVLLIAGGIVTIAGRSPYCQVP
jgi:nucleotide-binding universal stress UspA family protein